MKTLVYLKDGGIMTFPTEIWQELLASYESKSYLSIEAAGIVYDKTRTYGVALSNVSGFEPEDESMFGGIESYSPEKF